MIWSDLRVHFVHLHMRVTILVLEEGNHPLPQFPKFNMFVPWEDLNWRHQDTENWVVEGRGISGKHNGDLTGIAKASGDGERI